MIVEKRRVEMQQRRRTAEVIYELERLEQHFQRWSNAYAICMVTQAESARHNWKSCVNATKAQKRLKEANVKSLYRIKWEKYVLCC